MAQSWARSSGGQSGREGGGGASHGLVPRPAPLLNLHCTLHTAHCTLHTARCTLMTLQSTVHSSPCSAHCTLHTIHSLLPLRCTSHVHTAHCPYIAHCRLRSPLNPLPTYFVLQAVENCTTQLLPILKLRLTAETAVVQRSRHHSFGTYVGTACKERTS